MTISYFRMTLSYQLPRQRDSNEVLCRTVRGILARMPYSRELTIQGNSRNQHCNQTTEREIIGDGQGTENTWRGSCGDGSPHSRSARQFNAGQSEFGDAIYRLQYVFEGLACTGPRFAGDESCGGEFSYVQGSRKPSPWMFWGDYGRQLIVPQSSYAKSTRKY